MKANAKGVDKTAKKLQAAKEARRGAKGKGAAEQRAATKRVKRMGRKLRKLKKQVAKNETRAKGKGKGKTESPPAAT
jgi:hypothetical protein